MKMIDNIDHIDCATPRGSKGKYQCEIRDEDGEVLRQIEANEIMIRGVRRSVSTPLPQFDIRNIYAGDGRCFLNDGERLFCHRTIEF